VDNGCQEIIVDSLHALAVDTLPPIHRDPFDRLLIAQSMVEGTTLLTVDAMVAQYPAAIRRV
jgi:PIN domain nuclease of toxin-antitoxin system